MFTHSKKDYYSVNADFIVILYSYVNFNADIAIEAN